MKLWWSVAILVLGLSSTLDAMMVDLYTHKDRFGQSLQMDINSKCINIPRPWANVTQSINTYGSCMQFYDEKSCKGRIAVIQPFHTVHQMDLGLIQFDNTIQSISPCGPRVQSGRYVIQSAVDASILTVARNEGQFATVNTLPPRPFIPKAQQWDIEEKHTGEFDIMPRIHEENAPVTYDGDKLKQGNFVRKVWKIESVGRGRYIIRSDWTGRCLYKTRLRRVEEHDCLAWSPNQEWVFRPLLTNQPPKETATKNKEINTTPDNYLIPSRLVDQHLAQKKAQKDREDERKKKKKHQNNEAYLPPYRLVNRPQGEVSSSFAGPSLPGKVPPPQPEVLYTPHGHPLFGRPNTENSHRPPGGRPVPPRPHLKWINGVYPMYEDVKVEDPVFPPFLLDDGDSKEVFKNKKKPSKRNRPSRPKVQKKPADDTEEEVDEEQQEEESRFPHHPHHPEIRPRPQFPRHQERGSIDEDEDEEEEEEDDEPEPTPPVKNKKRVTQSQRKETTANYKIRNNRKPVTLNKAKNPNVKDDDDPAREVASFLKLLFQGISNRMKGNEKDEEDMIDMFE